MNKQTLKTTVIGLVIAAVLVSGVAYAASHFTNINEQPTAVTDEGKSRVENRVLFNEDYQKIELSEEMAQVPQEIRQWVQENYKQEYTGSQRVQGSTYILIARGESASPGYGIEIKHIQADENKAIVQARYTEPEPGTSYAMMITYPTVLIKFNQSIDQVDVEIANN